MSWKLGSDKPKYLYDVSHRPTLVAYKPGNVKPELVESVNLYTSHFQLVGPLTSEEQTVIREIASCQTEADLHNLWPSLCSSMDVEGGIRYIRVAINQM